MNWPRRERNLSESRGFASAKEGGSELLGGDPLIGRRRTKV